jgi:hypothetical protein
MVGDIAAGAAQERIILLPPHRLADTELDRLHDAPAFRSFAIVDAVAESSLRKQLGYVQYAAGWWCDKSTL